MPAELFRPAPVARRRAWLLPLSIAAHGVVLAGVFIAPIMADAELPDPAHAAPIYVEVTIPQFGVIFASLAAIGRDMPIHV